MWALWGWHQCPECGGRNVSVDNVEWISKKYLSSCCFDCYYYEPVNMVNKKIVRRANNVFNRG